MGDEAKVRSRPRTSPPRLLVLAVHVTPSERALLATAAKVSSMAVTSWIRHHALRTAAGVSRPPGPFKPPATRHSPGKREQSATAHFTKDEFEAIVEHARACGLTAGALVRELVLGCEPIARRPVVRSAIAAVHRAGTNLLQLIHLAGDGNPLTSDQVRAVTELRDEIHALRDALLRADAEGASDPAE
jgi:Mobilization protein NikA